MSHQVQKVSDSSGILIKDENLEVHFFCFKILISTDSYVSF